MASCGNLTIGATYDCDDPLQPGVNPRLILMNLDDILLVTYDVGNDRLITDISIKTGVLAAYAFDGFRQSLNPSVEFVPQTLSIGYRHTVEFQVFDISSTQKLNLEKMALGKIVAVVENKNSPGNVDSVFEVFGLGTGMEVQTMTRINRDLETAGSWSIVLSTPDNEGQEATLPISWFDTDYATTLALVDALLVPTAP